METGNNQNANIPGFRTDGSFATMSIYLRLEHSEIRIHILNNNLLHV